MEPLVAACLVLGKTQFPISIVSIVILIASIILGIGFRMLRRI